MKLGNITPIEIKVEEYINGNVIENITMPNGEKTTIRYTKYQFEDEKFRTIKRRSAMESMMNL